MRNQPDRFLAISFGEQQKRNLRTHFGLGINPAVADKNLRPRWQVCIGRIQGSQVGVMYRRSVPGAHDLKIFFKIKMLNDVHAGDRWLVFANSQVVTSLNQRIQRLFDARIY